MSDISAFSFGSSGLQRHKYGNSSIQYSADGRILSGGEGAGPYYNSGYRNGGDRHYYSSRRMPSPTRRIEAKRNSRNGYGTGFEPPAPLSDLTSDRPRNFQRYRTNSDLVRPHPQRVPDSWRGKDNYFGDYRKGSRRPSERRPKERRRQGRREKSSDPTLNPYGGCFVACGILIFACALVNILFSAEHHYYGGWWAGFLVLEFGLMLAVHRGKYHRHAKTRFVIAMGVVSILAVFVTTALTLNTLVGEFQLLVYQDTHALVGAYNNTDWTVNLPDVSQDVRVWVTFASDCAIVVLYAFSYLQILPLIQLSCRYWEENFRITNTCEPWSEPRFFNPFGQLVMAEVIAFAGIVVRYGCLYSPDDIPWFKYWVPVWGAALLFIAGVVSIIGFKRPDRAYRVYWGLLLQLLAGVAMGAGVVVNVNGLVENTEKIMEDVLSATLEKQYITSAVLYGICAVLQLPMVVYCMVVLGRLYVTGNKHRRSPYRDDRSFESASTTPTLRDRFVHGYPHGHPNTPLPAPPPPQQAYPSYPNYFGNHMQRY